MKLKYLFAAGAIALAHYVAVFAAWSKLPGNSASTAPGKAAADWWRVLSLPLFPLLGRDLATDHFGVILIANSALWGIGLSAVVWLLFKRLRP